MKIAITATGQDGNEELDTRFGRCEKFVFVDTDTGNRSVVENKAKSMGGAGIMAAQEVVSSRSEILIAPEVGPNAFRVLSSAGVKIFRSSGGSVDRLLRELDENKLEEANSPTVRSHHEGR